MYLEQYSYTFLIPAHGFNLYFKVNMCVVISNPLLESSRSAPALVP